MRHMINERGYTLLLTLLTVMLFTIIATILISFTISGAKKSESRESSTQSVELSEKGLQHAVKQLNKEVEAEIGENGISRELFKTRLESVLNEYKCETGSKLLTADGETGKYEVCIENYKNSKGSSGVENELRKEVSLKSVGTADEKKYELTGTYEIGAGTVPEVLKYAVGSNIRSKKPENGEGNLLLHGGVDIFGDVKVDGNLVTYDKGVGAYRWIDSIQPRMHGVPDGTEARLVVGGNMYKMTSEPYNNPGNESGHASYLNNTNFNQNRYTRTESPVDLFEANHVPQLVNREAKIDKVPLKERKNEFKFDEKGSGVSKQNFYPRNSALFKNFKVNNNERKKILPYSQECWDGNWFWGPGCNKANYDLDAVFEGENIFNSLSVLGTAKIKTGNHTFRNGLYVEKALTIGDNKQNNRDDITIDGPIYVNGDLNIQGANLTSNAMIYVDGNVEIRFSSIQGKKTGQRETGTMIIFATGNIFVANVSELSDNPTKMKGYFYSEKNIEMYGVGSNVHIDGGIAGNRVVLNALRGSVKSGNSWNQNYVPGLGIVESVSSQGKKTSRFTVKYDTELIENYLKLNPPEPVIYNVDPPEFIDRK